MSKGIWKCMFNMTTLYIHIKGVMVVQANGWFARFKIIVFEKLISCQRRSAN